MAYPPSTTYRAGTLSEAEYNADISGLASAMVPTNIDDYSGNVTQMQITVNPGGVGTESLAADLAGELARLRYMIKLITGMTHWYEDPGISLGASQFAATTRMVFQQTSAPTGWTKQSGANWNNSVFRMVTGAVTNPDTVNPSRTNFTTVTAVSTVGNTTLTAGQMPAHTHGSNARSGGTSGSAIPRWTNGTNQAANWNTGSAGSGNAHNHSINLAMKYVDLIVAEKDP